MESEFVSVELARRAIRLGFDSRPLGTSYDFSGTTLEQLERWIWKEHRELFPYIFKFTLDLSEYFYGVIIEHQRVGGKFPDPFTARLAGVERVIQVLEQQSKRKR